MTSLAPRNAQAPLRIDLDSGYAPGPRWVRRLLALLIGCLLGAGPCAYGEPPNPILSKFQRQDVPDDRVAEWSHETKGKIAITRAEFQQLLTASGAESRSKAAHITVAHYSATLAGRAFRDGRAKLTIQRVGDASVLMPLNQFNLAVRDFGWVDRPAIWGADDAGEIWLLADRPQGEIQMSWSAAGRSLADELDFDLLLPPAESAVLDLRVPRDQLVRSTLEARRVDEGSDANWQMWRLQLGGERRCRIAVSPAKPTIERKPAILFEHELGAIVREEDLRFQTVFQVEVFDAPVTELTFTVPSGVDVFAVTYGQDLPLTWTRSTTADSPGTLDVRLPGPLLGRSRPIRIDGIALQKPNSPMISPQIAVKDGIFVSGRQTLTIVAPLQLRSFRPTGFRQQTPLSVSPDGESYTFLQLLPDAQLVLDVGRELAALNAQVHTLFETSDSAWTLTSEVTWTASGGGVFQTECQFPPDWEITDVRLASEQGGARLAGVDVSAQPGGSSLLTVEFLEALEPAVSRTIRVLARRRPATTGASFGLPIPQPINCHSVETTLGLVLPSTLSPFISEDARVERLLAPDESILAAVRNRRFMNSQNEFWYRRESIEAGGTMQLVSRLRRVVASSETTIIASPAEYQEHYRVRCQAEGAPMDRLLVYFTERGSEVRWSIMAPRQGDLTAQRLPESQHADWNCPASGELWELRLPPLPAGTLQIEGRRANRWSTASHPALMVVPQAVDRRAQVTLSHPASLDLVVEAVGMDRQQRIPVDPLPDAQNPANSETALREETSVWQFEQPDARLSLTLRNPERSREFPTMVSLRLRSLLSANPQGFDLYRAQIRLENGAAKDQLRIRLNPTAVLQQVTIAGQATVPNMQGDELLVGDLNAADRDVVELLYRVPSHGGEVRDLHQIIVPQISANVLAFQWEFALPPSIRLYSEPQGVRLTKPLPAAAWSERIFGPLGRPRDEVFFNPFSRESWLTLMQPASMPSNSIGRFDQELIAPVEWQVHSAVSAIAPAEIWLETWQSRQTRLLSWISLTISLILGIVMRLFGWRYRDRLAAYWMALLLAAACCAPSPYAEIAGGAIAGTMIAMLSPRRSVITPRRDTSEMVPMGSTRSFDWGASVGLFLAASWLAATGFAQEATTSTVKGNSGANLPGDRAVRPSYLVPVDSSGKPSQGFPLVYLPQQLLTSLREAVRVKSPPQTLIASAHYSVNANPGGGDSLTAKFRVHVLAPSTERQIVFTIPDAFLTGEEACRVNGRPRPVLTTTDGRGFVVTLSPEMNPVPDSSSASTPETASFDVELDLRRVGARTARGGSFTANVPSVAACTWSLTLPEPAVFFDVSGARGAMTAAADRRSFNVDFGTGSQIEAIWSQNPPENRPRQVRVSQLQFLDLRSTHCELRFRISGEPIDRRLDAIDYIDLDLPARCLVREGDIRATNLLRSEVITSPAGTPQLRILFTEPQRQKFSIDGTLLIPGGESVGTQPLPQFGPSRSANVQPVTVQNWWCVNTSPEFRVVSQNLDAELLASIPPQDFFKAWGDSPPTGRHQLIFPLREGPAPVFTITPQIPRRRAVSWMQTGQVGKRRLEWTLTAKIETSQAPVYQHVLLVDRRLQIESISVMVGGAERRERWSETRHGTSPTRVVLFLKDKTSGLQQLTVKASLPTRFGRLTPLPFIRCEEIEQVDSRWELFRDSDVDVDLMLPRGVASFEQPADEPSMEDAPQLIARSKTADPDPRTSIRVSARQARCEARTAAVLTRTKDATWKLTGQLKLIPQGESSRRMGVQFPVAAFDHARIQVDNAEAIWHDPADGMRRLDLTLLPEADEVSISFDAVADEPSRGDWELPLPEPQEAVSHEIHLLMSPADAWTPLVGTELKPDESPGWATDFLSKLKPETPGAEYQLDGVPVRLRRSQSPARLDQPRIRLVDHTLWMTDDGRRFGSTRAFLSQTRDAIQFQVPVGFRLISLFLDERPLAMSTQPTGQLRIPLVGVARESILVMTWEQQQPLPLGPVQMQSDQLPWPPNIEVNRTLLSFVPYGNEVAVARNGRRQLEWIEASLDRMEMLLARQESLGNDPRAASANRALIDALQKQIESRLSAGIGQPSASIAAQLQRWNQAVQSLNRLDPILNPPPASTREPRTLQLEEPLFDLPSAVRVAVSDQNHSVNFWLFNRRWLDSISALAISLIAIPALRRLIRLDWGEWLSARTTIAWVLLGLIWWLCLTPGVAGPLIITITLWRAIRQRRQARDSVMVVD